MDFKQLDRKVWAAGQITHADLNKIGAKGFKAIICNRPDGEDDAQPDFDELACHAEQLGLTMHYVPYSNGAITPKLVHRLRSAIDGTDGPVLMFCRSGQRSTLLWEAVRGTARIAAE